MTSISLGESDAATADEPIANKPDTTIAPSSLANGHRHPDMKARGLFIAADIVSNPARLAAAD
jgi:hypothetical protein